MAITWDLLGTLGGGVDGVLLRSGPVTVADDDLTLALARVGGLAADPLPAWLETQETTSGHTELLVAPGQYIVQAGFEPNVAMQNASVITSVGIVLGAASLGAERLVWNKFYDISAYGDYGRKVMCLGVGLRAAVAEYLSVVCGVASATYNNVDDVYVSIVRVADEPLAEVPAWTSGRPVLAFFDFDASSGDATSLGLVDKAYASGIFTNTGGAGGLEYTSGNRPLAVYETAGDLGSAEYQWAEIVVGAAPTTTRQGVALRSTATEAIVCAANASDWRIYSGSVDGTATGTTLLSGAMPSAPVAGDRIGALITGGASPVVSMYHNDVELVAPTAITPGITMGLKAGIHLADLPATSGRISAFRAGGDWGVGMQKNATQQVAPASEWVKVVGMVRRSGLNFGTSRVLDDALVVPAALAGSRTVSAKITYGYESGTHGVRVYHNGVQVLEQVASGGGARSVSGPVTLAEGDELELWFWTDTTFSSAENIDGSSDTWLTVT